MGTTQYGYAIDIWSLGCSKLIELMNNEVISEILLGNPLFISLESDAEQLLSIFNSIDCTRLFFCQTKGTI